MTNINEKAIDQILNAHGFGESQRIGRRKNSAPKKFNPLRMMAAYEYISKDTLRMEVANSRLRNEVRAIAEGLEDIKEKAGEIKDKVAKGAKKAVDVLIKLIEKAIAFFTETVRYWFSAEKASAKVLAKLNAVKERNLNNDKADNKVKAVSGVSQMVKEFYNDIKLSDGTADGRKTEVETLMKKISDAKSDSKFSSADALSDHIDTEILSGITTKKEVAAKFKAPERAETTFQATYDDLSKTIETLIQIIEGMRTSTNYNMKGLNGEIKKLKLQRKTLIEKYKNDNKGKDITEETSTAHQKERVEINKKIKALTLYMGYFEKVNGNVNKLSLMVIDDYTKVTK